jgi:hypothetical protein
MAKIGGGKGEESIGEIHGGKYRRGEVADLPLIIFLGKISIYKKE